MYTQVLQEGTQISLPDGFQRNMLNYSSFCSHFQKIKSTTSQDHLLGQSEITRFYDLEFMMALGQNVSYCLSLVKQSDTKFGFFLSDSPPHLTNHGSSKYLFIFCLHWPISLEPQRVSHLKTPLQQNKTGITNNF